MCCESTTFCCILQNFYDICPFNDFEDVKLFCLCSDRIDQLGSFKNWTLYTNVAECLLGIYGKDCLNKCSENCMNSTSCDRFTGHCDGGCNTGWTGDTCDQSKRKYKQLLYLVHILMQNVSMLKLT